MRNNYYSHKKSAIIALITLLTFILVALNISNNYRTPPICTMKPKKIISFMYRYFFHYILLSQFILSFFKMNIFIG